MLPVVVCTWINGLISWNKAFGKSNTQNEGPNRADKLLSKEDLPGFGDRMQEILNGLNLETYKS